MTTGLVTVTLDADTGLPRDAVKMTLHVEALDIPAVAEDVATAVSRFFTVPVAPYEGAGAANALSELMSTELAGSWRIDVVDMSDPAPRVPIYTTHPATLSLGPNAYPQELALRLSARKAHASGGNPPRERGGFYVGPWGTPSVFVSTSNSRPSGYVRNLILAAGVRLKSELLAVDASWVIYSRTDHAPKVIQELYVDDAWDTIRSRGWSPTVRTVAPV